MDGLAIFAYENRHVADIIASSKGLGQCDNLKICAEALIDAEIARPVAQRDIQGIRMGFNKLFHRVIDKGRQITSFYLYTSTPFALALDSIRMKRRPYVAISGDGLKLSLLPKSGEGFTFFENIIRRDYLTNGITLGPGSTVVDIGANIGAFAVLAGSIVGPRGRVIAFEPVAKTFARLQGNMALNSLRNVECHRAAIGSRDCTITLRIAAKSAYATAHKVNEIGDDHPGETVPCLTLERVFEKLQIDRINLLKVDCEGSEYGIFETLSPNVAARIDQLAMEVHPVEGESADLLRERLVKLGFKVRCAYPWVAINTATVTMQRAFGRIGDGWGD